MRELSEQEWKFLDDGYCRRKIKERFYRWMVQNALGPRLDWKRTSRRLEEVTGTGIPHDTLRQNLRPVSKKKKHKPREFSDTRRWAALYCFVTDDRIGYLLPDELPEELRPFAAILALQEFISPVEEAPFPEQVSGRFTSLWDADGPQERVITLDIDTLPNCSAMRAELQEEIDPGTGEHTTYRCSYGGGAVWVDSFLMLVLRNRVTYEPAIWLVAQTDPQIIQDEEVRSLVLWRYNGLSEQLLRPDETWNEVDGERSLDSIRYRFDGRLDQYGLTRC